MLSERAHTSGVSTSGYSAEVRIVLHMAGESFKPAQIGGGMLIFSKPTTLPADSGVVVLSIDGEEIRWEVTLEPGQSPAKIFSAVFKKVA